MKTIGFVSVNIIVCVFAQAQTKKIVFVCEHGSAKSVIAATYFNKLAKEKDLAWEAVSRGTDPDTVISPKTKQLLIQDNLFDKTFVPKKLSRSDIDNNQQVFLFYPLPGNIKGKENTQYWLGIDAVNGDFIKLRDDILKKVVPLVDSLANLKAKR